MDYLEQAFGGNGSDRVDRVIALTKRLDEIRKALDMIRYDDELYRDIPEVAKLLGDAKDAVIAELKLV